MLVCVMGTLLFKVPELSTYLFNYDFLRMKSI